MASRSRVLTTSVLTVRPLSFLKYRFAPTTAAATSTTPITMKTFLRDIYLCSCECRLDGGDHQPDRHVDDEQGGRDWTGPLAIENAEADRQADRPPDEKQVDRTQHPRDERVLLEKRKEH